MVGGAVADLRGRRRLVAAHGRMAAAGGIEFSAQRRDFGLVSEGSAEARAKRRDRLVLHADLRLLQLPQLSADSIHLVDLIGYCA
jgi:hypothetical protein